MISDYVAYLAAQRIEEAVARSALSDTPVQPADAVAISADRFGWLRAWLGAERRRLADRLQQDPCSSAPVAMPRR